MQDNRPQFILGWAVAVTSNLLPSQSQTLAALVAAAARCERTNLAAIGRRMAGPTTAKSAVKWAWRFTCNRRVAVADAMAGIVAQVARRRGKRPMIIGLEWTDVRDFQTLMAAAPIGGRAVTLLWASYPKWKLTRSPNRLEEAPLRPLRTLNPGSVEVFILADRGFGRSEWAAVCQELGFSYLVRIGPAVTVSCARYRER